MASKPRVGLLPLYLKLYDESLPHMRETLTPFVEQVRAALGTHGVEVLPAPVCRLETEVAAAVSAFESAGADLIATLHLAYSPSLESGAVLAQSRLPLLLLDTTMDYDFGMGVAPERILYNHGIHGVQDLACVLRRLGKPFRIVAGHVTESDVLARAAAAARGAQAAHRLHASRVLRIGEPFRGMGDFHVEDSILREALGVNVSQIEPRELAPHTTAVTDTKMADEMAADRERYDIRAPEPVHRRSVRVGLGLRRILEQGRYDAFTANFLAFDSGKDPVSTVPFLEASKAMARGLGYAGEGDALTAALVGALGASFGSTTFTEIFCPDWKGSALFLSHMGEVNPEVAGGRPLLCEKNFPYTPAENPAFLACALAPGPAVVANLAPGPDDSFRLIVCPVEVLEGRAHPDMEQSVRGWVRPRLPLPQFLEEYSRLGGTHHSALVAGGSVEGLAAFADYAGLECRVL